MRLLNLTLPTPAENLALDEALLEAAEAEAAGDANGEVLRLWESPQPMVVVGRASRLDEEVERQECRREEIPIFRRVSGGATIVTGPGCLMYAVVLSIEQRPDLSLVDQVHKFVLGQMTKAFATLTVPTTIAGTSDLAFDSGESETSLQKFSGNSLRMKREWLLYHGTILYDFDLPLVGKLLKTPPRQPDYRAQRDHPAFVANLPASREAIVEAIAHAWSAEQTTDEYPQQRVAALVQERYGRQDWNASR